MPSSLVMDQSRVPVAPSSSPGGGIAQARTGCPAPDNVRESLQDLPKAQVFRAENVAFALASVLRCKPMPSRHIADINEIQSGVQIPGHLAGQEISYDLARRSWLEGALSNWGGRADDHNWQAGGGIPQSRLLGNVLGPFEVLRHAAEA